MPRFMVTLADTGTNEIVSQLVKAPNGAQAAVLHDWVTDIYSDKFISKRLMSEDAPTVISNFYEQTGWLCCIVNLDEEIMRELNGGDLSVSSQTPQL